ncbi:MAG: MFS transporter, partial [Streptomycetales bacterium]
RHPLPDPDHPKILAPPNSKLTPLGLSVITFLLLGGIVADRSSPRSVMVGASALAAVSQAITASLAVSHNMGVGALALLQIPNGAAAAFLFPAMNGTLPRTVPPHLLRHANAVSRTGVNIAMIGGAALSGTLIAAVGTGAALAINAGLYLTAAAAFATLKIRAASRGIGPSASMLQNLMDGWAEFRSRTWLCATVALFALINAAVAVGFETAGPMVANETYGGAGPWGVIVAAQGLGLVVGAALATLWKPARPLLAGWSAVLTAVPAFVALAIPLPVLAVALAAVLVGVGIEIFGVNWDLTMQRELPADKLSRMYSYDALGSNAAIPLAQMAFGPGLALLGIQGVLWLTTALVTATAVAGILVAGIFLAPTAAPNKVLPQLGPEAVGNTEAN